MGWRDTGRVLVVGLGNPGLKYDGTRHNIGFMLAEVIGQEAGVAPTREKFQARYDTGRFAGRDIALLLPQTFMNLSGRSVVPALSFFDLEPDQCIVLHDDIDLPLGDVRVKVGGGHGGHNGLRSIMQETGARDFVRVRLGVGRPDHGNVTGHVLGRFAPHEEHLLEQTLDVGLRAVRAILEQGPRPAMNAINGLSRKNDRAS